jgi:hypothetical protein
MSVEGAADVSRVLKTLPIRWQKRVVRSAVQKVGRKMVTRVKSAVGRQAVDSGLLKKSIGMRTWQKTTAGYGTAFGVTIGARKGMGTLVVRNKKGKKKALTRKAISKHVAAGGGTKAEYADPAKYAHLPEGGAKRKKHGVVKPTRYMEHTDHRYRAQNRADLWRELVTGLEMETRKLARARGL